MFFPKVRLMVLLDEKGKELWRRGEGRAWCRSAFHAAQEMKVSPLGSIPEGTEKTKRRCVMIKKKLLEKIVFGFGSVILGVILILSLFTSPMYSKPKKTYVLHLIIVVRWAPELLVQEAAHVNGRGYISVVLAIGEIEE